MKSHSKLESNIKHEYDILREGVEGIFPLYMGKVDQILKCHSLPASLQRTIFKFMANIDNWSLDSFGYHNIVN